MYTQKSFKARQADIEKRWYIVDAEDLIVGRLATKVATILRGKNKPQFTPNIDTGDFVIITNCEKVRFTGDKWDKKIYYWHTNHIGGIKQRTAKEQLEKHPELIIYKAVERMLPKTTLGRKQLTKLKVLVGTNHKHEAQNPEILRLS